MKREKILPMQAGITLIEIIMAIFIISIFSSFLLFSFSGIQENLRLTRVAHKLAQNLRMAQDLSLSGAEILKNGTLIKIVGYGIYFDKSSTKNKKYFIYADSCPQYVLPTVLPDFHYTAPGDLIECSAGDEIIYPIVDIDADEKGVYISEFNNVIGPSVSIDFVPPNPLTIITDKNNGRDYSWVEIVLAMEGSSRTKSVSINSAGLVEIK